MDARGLLFLFAVSTAGCSALLESTTAKFKSTNRSGSLADAGHHVLDASDDSRASTVSTNDPRFSTYVKAPKPQSGANFGNTLTMSGATLAVTAPFEDEVGDDGGTAKEAGATYLFDLNDATAPPTRLVVPHAEENGGWVPGSDIPQGFVTLTNYGALHVALDAIVVIGAMSDDSGVVGDPTDLGAPDSGAVVVYDRALGSWSQYIKEPAIAAGNLFGTSVALSSKWLVVGAPSQDGGAKDSGAVYVYERNGSRFSDAPAVLKPSIVHDGDAFGGMLALDGDLLAVSALGEGGGSVGIDGDPNDTSERGDGAVYIYRVSTDGRWVQEAYVKPSVATAFSYFGSSLSANNGRFAVGALGAQSCGNGAKAETFRGAAYVVSQIDGKWGIEQCVSAAHDNSLLGIAIGLYGDRLVAGVPWEPGDRADDRPDAARAFAGSASLYESDSSGLFHELPHLQAPGTEANQVFGVSVAIGADFVAVGAPWEAGGQSGPGANPLDMSAPKAGAVYLFSPTQP
jgi:hypothetical protein